MCPSRDLDAKRKILNSIVIVKGESDKRGEIWVGRVLFLCHCSMNEDVEGVDLALAQYMSCVPSLDALDESLRRLCLRWATAECGENENKVGRYVSESACTVRWDQI